MEGDFVALIMDNCGFAAIAVGDINCQLSIVN